MLRVRLISLFLLIPVGLVMMTSVFAQQEPTGVTAEPINQANVRRAPNVNADLMGEIFTGTQYPVLARSEFFPWFLLGDSETLQPIGWVFEDLVVLNNTSIVLPLSTLVLDDSTPFPSATLRVESEITEVVSPQTTPAASPTLTQTIGEPTSTPTETFTVYGVAEYEINLRYGPGVEYDRVGVAQPGESFGVTAYHTQFPWIQIRYDGSPNGFAWVMNGLLDVTGNVNTLPAVSQTFFNFPTLTPTPAVIQAGDSDVPLSAGFQALGNRLWNIVLNAGFDPATSRFAALYLEDLQTGESITFGSEFAFSGTSVNKISILTRLYETLILPPNAETALDIANTMICSENVATNRLLSRIPANDPSGDPFAGAAQVTQFLRQLGLQKTFITAPYVIPGANNPQPVTAIEYPQTSADQVKANPEITNQLTVDEMGSLLSDIYYCAYNESGPLIEQFGSEYDPRECRQMLHVMSNNTVDALLKAGVPADTRVAHKHGWIGDTHGNAAVFFTPGGDYVLTIMMYAKTDTNWIPFTETAPVMAEVSRTVYNYYNPDAPMTEIREGYIPEASECNFAGSSLISDLMSGVWDQ